MYLGHMEFCPGCTCRSHRLHGNGIPRGSRRSGKGNIDHHHWYQILGGQTPPGPGVHFGNVGSNIQSLSGLKGDFCGGARSGSVHSSGSALSFKAYIANL
jgi:hypothetical protein